MSTDLPEWHIHRVTVTGEGQMTLPEAIRDRWKLEAESVVDLVEECGAVTMRPARRRRSFREAIGTLELPDEMTAEEYISDMRHDPGDREILQSGPGVGKITYIDDLLLEH